MTTKMRTIGTAALALGAVLLAGCNGIGNGSTVQTMKVVWSPDAARDQAIVVNKDVAGDYPTGEHLRMFDCFCSNLTALGTFTDGTVANFNVRAKWTTSDPSVVQVANYDDSSTFTQCPLALRTGGMLIPQPGATSPRQAVVTAEFVGMKASYVVEVNDTVAAAAGTFKLAPYDATNTGQVAVGGLLPLALTVTLDGQPRNVNLVGTYVLNPATPAVGPTVGTIDSIGEVSGLSADLGTPLNAVASFGTCPAVTVSAAVRVGEPVAPITIEEEPGLATDHKLAVNSNEYLKVTTALDFGDGSAAGSQLISTQVAADFTDPCTTRDFDATVAGSNCRETATTCPSSMNTCAASTATTCTSGMATCRVTGSPMAANGGRIVATTSATAPTTFFANFPAIVGTATTLAADMAASTSGAAETLTVAAYAGYPSVFPYEADIESEIVQVTAVSGTTLSINRGYAGTTAAAHLTGAAFKQHRVKTTNTIDITADPATLSSFTIDAPASTTLPLYSTLQLTATGTFDDSTAGTSRSQRVTQLQAFLPGSPAIIWSSNKPGIATVATGSGVVQSLSPCGGTVVVRARTRNSTSTTQDDDTFATPDTAAAGADDLDHNGNTDANDAACLTGDAACDQVTLTVPRASPLPPGYTDTYCDSI